MVDEEEINGKVISFLNMKGGVGKTTLCKEIGYHLAKNKGFKVLFIDIDPQSNLTQSLFVKYNYTTNKLYSLLSDEEKRLDSQKTKNKLIISNASIENLFTDGRVITDTSDIILNIDSIDNIDLIPGELDTVFLGRTAGGAEKENKLDNFILENKLNEIYNYILIDCPPTYSFYTTAALNCSDYYFVPVSVDSYSILGIDLLEKVVTHLKQNDIRRFRYKNLENLGIIFNPQNGLKKKTLEENISAIKKSYSLEKHNLYFFDNRFRFKNSFRLNSGYFVDDYSDRKSINNLDLIVDEFLERINIISSEEE